MFSLHANFVQKIVLALNIMVISGDDCNKGWKSVSILSISRFLLSVEMTIILKADNYYLLIIFTLVSIQQEWKSPHKSCDLLLQ